MSGNKQYREQFDSNAGKPADFESLFSFSGEEIVAKRRIRMYSKKNRLAAMTSAAAVIAVVSAASLTLLHTSGLNDGGGIAEMNAVTETELSSSAYARNAAESEFTLSSLISRFDYTCGVYQSNDSITPFTGMDSFLNSDIITHARVTSKTYDGEAIIYTLMLLESYNLDTVDTLPPDSLTVKSSLLPAEYSLCELQTGSEYILPLDYNPDDAEAPYSLTSPMSVPIRKTDRGWLIDASYSDFTQGAHSVVNDMTDEGYYGIGFVLDPSDESMKLKLRDFAEISENKYYHREFSNDINTTAWIYDLFNYENESLRFENVKYLINDDGTEDKTTLLLENEKYFELSPAISGTVIFAGESLTGENFVAVDISEGEFTHYTVFFTGMSEITVKQGDTVSNSIIGMCSEEPIYCRFTNSSGPVEINLYDEITEVVAIE